MPRVDGLSFDQWLAGHPQLPEGFRQWKGAWGHWFRGDELGWAIVCYGKSRKWRKIQWHRVKQANTAKKTTDAPG